MLVLSHPAESKHRCRRDGPAVPMSWWKARLASTRPGVRARLGFTHLARPASRIRVERPHRNCHRRTRLSPIAEAHMRDTIIIRERFYSRDDAEEARERLEYSGFAHSSINIMRIGDKYEL